MESANFPVQPSMLGTIFAKSWVSQNYSALDKILLWHKPRVEQCYKPRVEQCYDTEENIDCFSIFADYFS